MVHEVDFNFILVIVLPSGGGFLRSLCPVHGGVTWTVSFELSFILPLGNESRAVDQLVTIQAHGPVGQSIQNATLAFLRVLTACLRKKHKDDVTQGRKNAK